MIPDHIQGDFDLAEDNFIALNVQHAENNAFGIKASVPINRTGSLNTMRIRSRASSPRIVLWVILRTRQTRVRFAPFTCIYIISVLSAAIWMHLPDSDFFNFPLLGQSFLILIRGFAISFTRFRWFVIGARKTAFGNRIYEEIVRFVACSEHESFNLNQFLFGDKLDKLQSQSH